MLEINDLKKGEIYTITDTSYKGKVIIHKYERMSDSNRSYGFYLSNYDDANCFVKNTPWLKGRIIKTSTPEEQNWLNECIKANKFISYEEAMKTFKPQYIVNKWYKVKDWKFSYYVKFKSLEKVGYNKINGEIINAGTYKGGDDYLANNLMKEKLELLEDLSEIQEFLPSNHPDKVSNSLIGRYVKCLRNNANSCRVNDESVKEGEYYTT